jgi:hypothetical protein
LSIYLNNFSLEYNILDLMNSRMGLATNP